MMRILAFVIAAMFALPGIGSASSPTNRPLEALFKSADAVIVGKVASMTASCDQGKDACNRLYVVSFYKESIKELKSVKGPSEEYKTVCSNVPLEIDSTYTLFIEAPTKFNTAGSDKCRHVVDFDGVFEKIGSYVYRVGSPDAKIIVDFEGGKYLTNAVVEPGFEQAIDSLTKP